MMQSIVVCNGRCLRGQFDLNLLTYCMYCILGIRLLNELSDRSEENDGDLVIVFS